MVDLDCVIATLDDLDADIDAVTLEVTIPLNQDHDEPTGEAAEDAQPMDSEAEGEEADTTIDEEDDVDRPADEDADDVDEPEPATGPTDDDVVSVDELPEISSSIASRLRGSGYETAADVEAASVEDLTDIPYVGGERARDVKTAVDDYDADADAGDEEQKEDVVGGGDDEPGLKDDLLEVLDEKDGRVDQEVLVNLLPAAKSTVSKTLSRLEDDEEIAVVDVGRGNLVCRPSAVPEGAGTPDQGTADKPADDDSTDDEAGSTVAADGHGEPAFVEYDVAPNDLVDALDGATSATDVARTLGITDTQVVGAILDDFDLHEELSSRGTVDRQTAERAVREVAERAS